MLSEIWSSTSILQIGSLRLSEGKGLTWGHINRARTRSDVLYFPLLLDSVWISPYSPLGDGHQTAGIHSGTGSSLPCEALHSHYSTVTIRKFFLISNHMP